MSSVSLQDIQQAQQRIQPFINQTPILESTLLNEWLGHRILFKAECLQKIGAFKIRGALNMLLKAQEEGTLASHIVASSSGNHAQAVAYAAKLLGKKATIFSGQNISSVKAAATRFYGAELKLYPTRREADQQVKLAASEPDTLWVPPFNHADIIAGQGTVVADALEQTGPVNGVFAPVGGGGLVAGTLIYAKGINPNCAVVGSEPLMGNDAAQSLRAGTIQSLDDSPNTLADGAATLAVGEETFPFLQQLDDIVEVSETQIAYWTQWLQHLLKIHVEPTSAMSMQAVCQWLKNQNSPQTVLVILSGGNIDQSKMQKIWQTNHLEELPNLLI
ncbi:serine/threonine dehydratase [Paraglaciecola hydrolytica]|uniref:Threonine dehydratase n=1 Tax=Paraglaciecola hydrolytica TaxID=1799789 RepID=A0A136A4Y5_9ALTE|nr:serine/threonine dehydratase [Paraglaciecola hydrolytica]KXI30302.1 threonine dehydratase [Paraglaciecola hydrolytica]